MPPSALKPTILVPLGLVRSTRSEPVDDNWGGVESTIVLDPARVPPEAVHGLDDFSHLEIVFVFHRVDPDAVTAGARRPRGNPQWPEVGILAQRARWRPNRLGVSRCRLLTVRGLELRVEGLDAIDGTPVLDVKPYLREFGPRGDVRQPEWATELMRDYYRNV